MADLWEYLKNLFGRADKSSPANPFIHELIERSEEEKADYERWKKTLVCRRLQGWLADQYAIFTALPDDIDEALDFLDTPSSQGFVIHLHKTQYSRRDATHFCDFLRERVLNLNYRTQISDTRTYQKADRVETSERHYLKPRPDWPKEQNKMRQQYGNITIELLLQDDQPYRLKLQATHYRDFQYEEPWPFKELMQVLMFS